MEQMEQRPGNFRVWSVVRSAYVDSWRAVRAMPVLVLTTLALLLLVFAARAALGLLPSPFLRPLSPADQHTLGVAAQPFLLAVALVTISLQIAVHRYVLIRQECSYYSALPQHRRFLEIRLLYSSDKNRERRFNTNSINLYTTN